MMGDRADQRRQRLFVSTSGDRLQSTARRCSAANTRDPTRLIRYEVEHRSTAATAPPTTESFPTTVVEGSLGELGVEISETISDFSNTSGGLAPSEFRLCFDSLASLLANDHDSVFRFFHLLIGRLKSVNGMGHFHLPRPWSAEVVSVFQPLFDAVIELRLYNETLQQRWHLTGEDVTTRWLSPIIDTNC